MPLQTDDLIMVGLGVLNDQPPHPVQPKLPSGVHLTWRFDPERGLPWHGYYLVRRAHKDGSPACIAAGFDPAWPVGSTGGTSLALADGLLTSDTPLALTELFAGAAAREVDLRGRSWLRFAPPAGQPVRKFVLHVGFLGERPAEDRGETGGGKDENPKSEDPKAEDPKAEDPRAGDLAQRAGCLGGLFGLRGGPAPPPPPPPPPPLPPPPPPPGPAVSLRITAFDDGVPVVFSAAYGTPGQVVTVEVAADRMDAVEIEGGPAVLVDLCVVPVAQDWGVGWGAIPGFTYPMCLPSAKQGYPCEGRPVTDAQAEALALGRIWYGPAGPWHGARVAELRKALDDLVVWGPSAGPMADRSASYPDSLGDPDAPAMPDQHPLDLVLLAAINPAVAQMVGLYWIDDPEGAGLKHGSVPECEGWGGSSDAQLQAHCIALGVPADAQALIAAGVAAPAPGLPLMTDDTPSAGAYDYLILADHSGRYHGDVAQALAALANPLPADVDGWICFDLRKQAAPPLAAPTELNAFALPGTATGAAAVATDQVCAAGLRWRIPQTEEGDLLPEAHVGYHLWRADLGATQPTGPAAPAAYSRHLTQKGMVMIAGPDAGAGRQYASDWPPFPLHRIDPGLTEGWYAYVIRGMDIFGRISLEGGPAEWRQWGPEPAPRPWYYADPPGDAQVNPYAVNLLCKTPPPPVPGVEAWTLDPLDPDLAGETAYDAWAAAGWWNGLPAVDQGKRAGVRVAWTWSLEQMAQAPRTKEFRIYLSPGGDPPAGYQAPTAWPERIHVVDVSANHVDMHDGQGVLIGRRYEVLLPVDAAGTTFQGAAMEPTDLDPVVYAQVAVTAADDRSHTADDPKWASGAWGGRDGNEGRIAAAAKIVRVLRAPPPAPPLIGDDDKVWATRADYHGVSRWTVRWAKPAPGQRVHVFRAVDDSLFRVDWERRRAAGATAFVAADVQPFGWDAASSQAMLDELTADLDAVKGLDWDADPAVRAAYEGLSERALRVLASFDGNADAFVQATWEPLDPAAAENADRAGPDARAPYAPNPAWGAWTAELDGKASNRWFFRAAYVNSAHTVGPMGPSSPAVYLPKVAPPRTPAITKVESGELAITVSWAHNREPDFAEHRLYRADDERQARDVRLMTKVATVTAAQADLTQDGVTWTDADGLVGGRTYVYRLTAVDTEGNESAPSAGAGAVAVETRAPPAPMWAGQRWVLRAPNGSLSPWPADDIVPAGYAAALALSWICKTADPVFSVTTRRGAEVSWRTAVLAESPRLVVASPSRYRCLLLPPEAEAGALYRVMVRGLTGAWSEPSSEMMCAPAAEAEELGA